MYVQTRRQRLRRAIRKLNPVAYYPLNEPSGTTAINNALDNLNSLNGTITGATVGQAGLSGKAYSFDGSSDYVVIGNSANLQFTTGVTLLALVNLSSDPAGEVGIISKSNHTLNESGYYNLIIRGDASNVGRMEVSISGVGYRNVSGTTTLSAGTWYLLAGVYDKTSIRFYLNGSSEGTPDAQTANMDIDTRSLQIGAHVETRYFPGKIQHAAVFNKALTLNEITKIARIAGLV